MRKTLTRRSFAGLLAALSLAGCERSAGWHMRDVTGALPSLAFHMVRASDGETVGADAYRNQIVLLYFGYTQCPDACPLALGNLARVVEKLGPDADRVHVLFVTVDPRRDDLKTLRGYTQDLGPRFDGLRGDVNQLARLARRYRVAYAAGSAGPGKPYVVTHSNSVYVFDGHGRARLATTDTDDTAAIAADLERLLHAAGTV